MFRAFAIREEISKKPAGTIVPVPFQITPELQTTKKLPPYIVFQGCVNSSGGIDQLFSGHPCQDEFMFRLTQQAIEFNCFDVPVIFLGSWQGNFAIFPMWLEFSHEELSVFCYHSPRLHNGKRCKYSIRHYRKHLNQETELISEEFLSVIKIEKASAIMREKQKQLESDADKRNQVKAAEQNRDMLDPAMVGPQLTVLSKVYPKTVKLMRENDQSKRRALAEAFQIENLAFTGILNPPLEKHQYAAAAKALANAARRKDLRIDPIQYAIAGGWRYKGFDKMSNKERVMELEKIGLKNLKPDTIRKLCKRLLLPPPLPTIGQICMQVCPRTES